MNRHYQTLHPAFSRTYGLTQLLFDEKGGLREIPPLRGAVPVGTFHHLNGRWRMRVKRRTAGCTWKDVELRHLPKRLRAEALLMGVKI